MNEYLIVWCAASVPQGDNASLRWCDPVYKEPRLACTLGEYDGWALNEATKVKTTDALSMLAYKQKI